MLEELCGFLVRQRGRHVRREDRAVPWSRLWRLDASQDGFHGAMFGDRARFEQFLELARGIIIHNPAEPM